jgi:predicted amidohydrolase
MADVRVAAIQLGVGLSQDVDLARAADLIAEAAANGARLVVLPERFCQWASDSTIATMAEEPSGTMEQWQANRAREHGIYLVGGSVLERATDAPRPYNASLLFSPDGTLLGRYRKIHLFDAVVDGVTHGESDTISAGDKPVCVDTELATIGMTICYDLRFPELFRTLADRGMQIATLPAGFTRVTGQAHWEVLVRARAIENQCFVIAAGMYGRTSPARDFFGHSMIVDPWGKILAELAEGEGVVTADLSFEQLQGVRTRLPALQNRRLGSVAVAEAGREGAVPL